MIARYLQDRNLTGIEPGRDYYNIEHNFLGIALKGEHHSSLPLISAAIYCYVARKFTLDAHPCGFPFHVHVIIRPHAGHDMDGNAVGDGDQGAPMYMDPFRSIQETPVTELQSQLRYLGALTLSDSTFLRESLTSEIVLRCGKNILNSVTQTPVFQYTTLDLANVKYAALWSSMLFADYATLEGRPLVGVPHGQRHQLGHITLRRHLPSLMEQFATDFSFDVHQIEKFLLPLFDGLPEHDHLQESIRVMKASDDIPKQIRRRTSDYENVKYRVGQIFRHRRYEYVAVIIGWDPECGAGEQWMRQMGIDRLRAGRYQSFYHALYVFPTSEPKLLII